MADHSWVNGDSTWEGWTQPSQPLGAVPEGRKLPGGPPGGWHGTLRSLPKATDDSIKYAARIWPQAQADDFDRDGRRYVERATAVEYRLVRGNPLLAEDTEVADCFFVEDSTLWFLRRADRSEVRSRYLGSMGAIKVER